MNKIPEVLLKMSDGIEKILEAVKTPEAKKDVAALKVKVLQHEDLIRDLEKSFEIQPSEPMNVFFWALQRIENEKDDTPF